MVWTQFLCKHSLTTFTLCSTPYGINGLDTLAKSSKFSRKKPCSTPYGINGLDTRRRSKFWGHLMGAQRLTASMVWTLPIRGERGRCRLVCSTPYGINGLDTILNHQLPQTLQVCSTPYGINGLDTIPKRMQTQRKVLCSTPYGINGLDTKDSFADFTKADLCSTPYGINGLDTGYFRELFIQVIVLNALRHQWFGHP